MTSTTIDQDYFDDNDSSESSYQADGFASMLERFLSEAFALRYLILAIVILSLIIGVVATLIQKPLYRAASRIEISMSEINATNIQGLEARNRNSAMQYMQTQYELLQSRFLADQVVESANLTRNEKFLAAYGIEGSVQISERQLSNILLGSIRITPLRASNLVDISFSSPDPQVSADIANLWAEQFLESNYNKRFGANIEARDFLQRQIEEMRERLERSEQELIEYSNANEIFILKSDNGQEGGNSAEQTLVASELQALNQSLADATAARIKARSALTSGGRGDGDASATNELRNSLVKAEAERAKLRSTFGPDYPQLVAVEAEVASLRRALREFSASDTGEVRAKYNQAVLEERALRARFQQAKAKFLRQQDKGVEYGILDREVETNRELYNALLQRFKELGAAGAGKNNMSMVDAAEPPGGPYQPSLMINLALSLLIGILAAAIVVYLRYAIDQSLRDPDDVKRFLGVPALGLIPRVEDDELEEQLISRNSHLSEAYAAARTNLNFLSTDGAPGVIMLTSTRPNEGKSLSAVALARSFAFLEKKILLIDADLRNSAMLEYVGEEHTESPGLSAVLSNNAEVHSAIHPVEQFGFDLLPSGLVPPNPVELVAGPKFAALVETLSQQYDHILIDGPPVLNLADALEISRVGPGFIYIVESNGAKVRMIEQAMSRLKRSNTRIFGAIVTKLDERSGSYGYGYGYGYGANGDASSERE